jgi:hypothetical protein
LKALTDFDPIASEIGHGAPGLRDNLRVFDELVRESASQKHIAVSLQGGKLIPAPWTSSAGAYYAALATTYGGQTRDVVGCKTATVTLVRAETLTLCRATNNTYWWDETNARVYVRLGAGTDPTGTDVLALLSFCVGSDPVVHPSLGPEKLVDGGLDVWTTDTNLTNWEEDTSGGGSVTRATGFDAAGSYSVLLSGTLNAGTTIGIGQAAAVGVGGATYRFSGWYRTPLALAGITARLRIGTTPAYLASDGRSLTADVTGLALAPTYGERRRFCFDFVCPADAATIAVYLFALNSTAGAITLYGIGLDGLSLRRVWRYELYEPRISASSLPEVDERHTDAFFGMVARGTGTLVLVNGDGHFESILGDLDWMGREFTVRIGGRYVGGGNEILWDDMYPRLVGLIAAQPRLTDMAASLSFEDITAKLAALLPPNAYGLETFPSLASSDNGRRRPLVFGTVLGTKPARLGMSSGRPYYEMGDPTLAPHQSLPFQSLDALWLYADESAAERADTAKRVAASYTVNSPGPGQVRLALASAYAIEIVAGENDMLDFAVGAGGEVTAVLTAGVYTPSGLATHVASQMMAASGGAHGASYAVSGAGDSFNLASTGPVPPNLTLKIATGTNRQRSAYATLGFAGTADLAGSTNYNGAVTYTDVDRQSIVRVDMKGYRDDASGTYTGSAVNAIEIAPDIVRCLLERWFGVEASQIDAASFVAGRASCPELLAAYIGAPGEGVLDGRVVLERICNGADADLVFEREKFYWRPRATSVPANVTVLQERDYLAFEAGYEAEDTHDIVRVAYLQDPAQSDRWTMVQATDSAVRLRWNRQEQRTFYTYLTTEADASARLATLAAEASSKRRRFTLTAKGVLLPLPLGTRLQITRAKGLGSTGSLTTVLCRLLGKRDNMATWPTAAELIEVV